MNGSIAMTDLHTVISACNRAKPQKQKLQLPDFMAKRLQEYRGMMDASEDGGAAGNSGSKAADDIAGPQTGALSLAGKQR